MTDPEKIPKHVAIIPDGNRRYEKREGLPEFEGHRQGLENIRHIVRVALGEGVEFVTVYALSLENLVERKPEERDFLFELFRVAFKDIAPQFHEENIRVRFIGDLSRMPPDIAEQAHETEEKTKGNDGGTFVAAIAYGGRDEIVRASDRREELHLQHAIREVEQRHPDRYSAGEIAWEIQKAMRNLRESETEDTFFRYLDTAGLSYPCPDLIIRTARERRVSNLLPYQAAYAEYHFFPELWPEFSEDNLHEALQDFATRERRFGGDRAAL